MKKTEEVPKRRYSERIKEILEEDNNRYLKRILKIIDRSWRVIGKIKERFQRNYEGTEDKQER